MVSHPVLLKKLNCLGVDSGSLQWFQSYLSHRMQRTVLNNCFSSSHKVSIGVPQGSVLAPLLFLVYINDLPSCLQYTQASLCADDTAVYCAAFSPEELQVKLNEDLRHLKFWLDDNRLTLNITKSKFMLVGGPQRLKKFESLTLSIDDQVLGRESKYKYLGVVINETLSWADHIDYVQKKVSKRQRGCFETYKTFIANSHQKASCELFVFTIT